MATVKIHEGTKFETSVDLQEDEGIIFVVPEKNRFARMVSLGCTKGTKIYYGNLVITSKRVITIPHPPNKKNYPADSFYFKDIASVKMVKQAQASQEAGAAQFAINMKPGQTSSCTEIGTFYIYAAMTVKNFLNVASAAHAENVAKNHASGVYAGLQMEDYAHYTAKSVDKYWDTMNKRAQERAKNMDFSSADHAKIRDYIVDLINDCVAEAAKG